MPLQECIQVNRRLKRADADAGCRAVQADAVNELLCTLSRC